MDKFQKTDLTDVLSRRRNVFRDNRGNFQEIIRTEELPSEIPPFVQDSASVSSSMVLRGFHIQELQWQLVTLITGEVDDILIDLRSDSPTFLSVISINLHPERENQILIPPGVAHGYCAKGRQNVINYKSSRYYGETREFGVSWKSIELSRHIPDKNWTVSERDNSFPLVQEFLIKDKNKP